MKLELIETLAALSATLLFLIYHGLFVAVEFAFLRLRFTLSPWDEEWLDKRRYLIRLFDHPETTTRLLRMGGLVCAFGFIFSLVATYATVNEGALDYDDIWLLGTCAASLGAYYTLAELLPRALGLNHPDATLIRLIPLLRPTFWLLTPLNRALVRVSNGLLTLMGVRQAGDISLLDLEEQLENTENGTSRLSPVTQSILRNTIHLHELVVSDVLLPRHQVKFWDLSLSVNENLAMVRESGHTRFPLCDGDLDRCLGLIHVKDLFRHKGPLEQLDPRQLKREIVRVDINEPLEQVLSRLLNQHLHMALVIDEFRGAAGVLTLERVLEQLVGDIRDEFDAHEEDHVRLSSEAGEAVVSGLTPLHELEDIFGIEIVSEEVSTLSGLITSELGRIPEVGEILHAQGLAFEVTQVDETRVIEARVRALPPETADEVADAPPGDGDEARSSER